MGLKLKKTFFRMLMLLTAIALFIVSMDWYLESTGYGADFGWLGIRNIEREGLYLQFIVPALLSGLSVLTFLNLLASSAENLLVTQTEKGDVIKLAPSAVEKRVQYTIRERVPEVLKVSVSASQNYALLGLIATRKLNVQIAINVAKNVKVSDLNEKVKNQATGVLKEIFGLDDVYNVKVAVNHVSADRGPRKLDKKPAAAGQKNAKSRVKRISPSKESAS